MAIRPWYATREQVQRALDVAETARADSQIDDALAAATEVIDGTMHRRFTPVLDTRSFDWPNYQYARSWRLWLEADELAADPTSIVNGDDGTLLPGDFLLRPDTGPPFTSIEVNLATSEAWSSGVSTHQGSIVITGTFGYSFDWGPAGALAGALDASEVDVDVTDGSKIGVGDLLRVEDEWMVVTGRTWLDSGQGLGAALDASPADTGLAVADGTAFHAGEQLTVDAERMLVVDVVGNVVVVKRAYRGSVLAAHLLGADIFVDRTLTVARGASGSTAGAHGSAAPVERFLVPPAIRTLCLAEALVTFEQEKAAYARTAGSGETEREARGPGLAAAREAAWTRHARQARLSAI